jgi:hypothetical protein
MERRAARTKLSCDRCWTWDVVRRPPSGLGAIKGDWQAKFHSATQDLLTAAATAATSEQASQARNLQPKNRTPSCGSKGKTGPSRHRLCNGSPFLIAPFDAARACLPALLHLWTFQERVAFR